MPSFQYQNCDLHYRRRSLAPAVAGNCENPRPRGKTLIFLHGLGADCEQALSLCAEMKNLQVICVDMPGHGQSVCSDREKFTFAFFAEVTRALMDELGIASALLGGISMGAGVCLQVAMRWPERVEALLLQRPAWLNTPAVANLEIVASVGLWIDSVGLDHAQKKLNKHDLLRELDTYNPPCARSIRALLDRPQALSAAAVLPALVMDQPFICPEQLGEIRTPTLVLSCEHDPLHPLDIALGLAKKMANCTFREIPSRYLKPEQHFQQFTYHAQRFLNRLTAPEYL